MNIIKHIISPCGARLLVREQRCLQAVRLMIDRCLLQCIRIHVIYDKARISSVFQNGKVGRNRNPAG